MVSDISSTMAALVHEHQNVFLTRGLIGYATLISHFSKVRASLGFPETSVEGVVLCMWEDVTTRSFQCTALYAYCYDMVQYIQS